MKEIYISIKNELKHFLHLFHTLSKIYFYFDNIYIYCDLKYIEINILLYYNLYNVIFIKNININTSNTSNNSIYYFNEEDFIQNFNINYIKNTPENNMIFRNICQENIFYIKLTENISKKYIFYFNYDTNKIINYFGDLYIYNPIYDFYEDNDKYYDKWIDLYTNNMAYYLKIIEESTELHIYDLDILYLISEIDVSHISKKYFYYDTVLIKEDNNKFKDWDIILIE